MEEETLSTVSIDEIANSMAQSVNIAIQDVEEITRTNPKVTFDLGRDKSNKLILVATVSFPDEGTISPMEYTERLVASDLIKTLVANQMRAAVGNESDEE